jgi:hypothetical protein
MSKILVSTETTPASIGAELVLTNGLDAGSAAFDVGLESATQFNRECSRLFRQAFYARRSGLLSLDGRDWNRSAVSELGYPRTVSFPNSRQ